MSRNAPTISELLRELADRYTTIVPEREVFDQVLARRPSQAKNPYASIRNQLRVGPARVGWVALGGGELVPLRVVLEGLRFRLQPSTEQIASGMLPRLDFRPFLSYTDDEAGPPRFEDAHGQPLAITQGRIQLGMGLFGLVDTPAFDLGTWFRHEQFAPNDSLLVTIRRTDPLLLRIEREPQAAFHPEAVIAQEHELLDALTERVNKDSRNMIGCDEAVLPVYARAAWRAGYPGRPWQQLVDHDPRLRLLDGDFIADSSFRRPLDVMLGQDHNDAYWQATDSALLKDIEHFQSDVLSSRRDAVDRGLWNGIAPRVSTAHTIFDFHEGTSETIYPGAVDTLSDHSADIEEHIAHGDYQRAGWTSEDDDDDLYDDFDDVFVTDEDLQELADIEDMQSFFDQHPELAEAARKLMDSLSPEEAAKLQQAETIEDVQQILASRMTDLFHQHPELFVPLELPSSTEPPDVPSNGKARTLRLDGDEWVEDVHLLDDEWVDEDELDDEAGLEEDEEDEEDDLTIERALNHSNELMDEFYRYQLGQGKSESTAASRARDLWVYADFLGHYYGRSLDHGDYATLDECLFFFYPRKVLNSTPRAAREMCTSLKQFYAFLKSEERLTDDAFAIGMWQRREQAARVVTLYDRIDGDSPQFERLFAHLFAPYTA